MSPVSVAELKATEVKRKSIQHFSYKALPNIKDMTIELGAIDPVVQQELGGKEIFRSLHHPFKNKLKCSNRNTTYVLLQGKL